MNLDNICEEILDEEQDRLMDEADLALEEATQRLTELATACMGAVKDMELKLVKAMQDALAKGHDPEKGVPSKVSEECENYNPYYLETIEGSEPQFFDKEDEPEKGVPNKINTDAINEWML